ncbi:MAG: PilZ domain-containing protein [Planctomycetes bacterium]|nr:PilZ domain-containing protein [Planctomycetota bacterium]
MDGEKRPEKAEDMRRSERKSADPGDIVMSFRVEPGDFDISNINISEHGIGFTTSNPLGVQIRLKDNNDNSERLANLVWVKRQKNGAMQYGFEFID